jgi:ABC-type multidrug transport system ATPase subunit
MRHIKIHAYFERLQKAQRRVREFNAGFNQRLEILMKLARDEKLEMLGLAAGGKKFKN